MNYNRLDRDADSRAMIELEAETAMNLDGGGSASLVAAGEPVNTPRAKQGIEPRGGREIATTLHRRVSGDLSPSPEL